MSKFNVPEAIQRKIKRGAKLLNEALAEAKEHYPDNQVGLYLDGTQNLCLMVEPEGQGDPEHEYRAYDVRLNASGGDW